MKSTFLGIALAALLLAVSGLSHAKTGGSGAGGGQLQDCRQANSNALKPVEAQYASASAKLPKADQDLDAATRSRTGGFSDWFIPDSGQLALLWEQRAVVGNFQAHYDHYWSSTRMQGDRYQQAKVYWRTFNNGGTGWSDTSDNGPNRPLFNARAIRKF